MWYLRVFVQTSDTTRTLQTSTATAKARCFRCGNSVTTEWRNWPWLLSRGVPSTSTSSPSDTDHVSPMMMSILSLFNLHSVSRDLIKNMQRQDAQSLQRDITRCPWIIVQYFKEVSGIAFGCYDMLMTTRSKTIQMIMANINLVLELGLDLVFK